MIPAGRNYEAWKVRAEDYPKRGTIAEQLSFLLRYAVLAPSSHNSQPWQFRVVHNTIEINPVLELLPVADTAGRLLGIALGCVVENIKVAGDFFGWKIECKCFLNKGLITCIKLLCNKKENREGEASSKRLIFSIPQRVTNRFAYKAEPPADTFLENVKNVSTHDVQVSIVVDGFKRQQLADLVVQGRSEAMEDKVFRYEMAAYKKNNLTRSYIGMPGFDMGFPFLKSLLTPFVLRHWNVARWMEQKERELWVNATPAVVIISSKDDTAESCVKTGECLEKVLLMAAGEGVATATTAAATQVKDNYKKVQALITTMFRPQVCVRLGYPTREAFHSPRVNARQVTVAVS